MTSTPALPSLSVHSILYRNDPTHIARAVLHLNRAVELALVSAQVSTVRLSYGDCSEEPALSAAQLDELRAQAPAIASVEYQHFRANLGSAAGHNRLLHNLLHDYVLVMNPDVMLAPDALRELFRPYARAGVGMVEARQCPIEHPKEFDPESGETSWASTACVLIPGPLLRELGGFDSSSFFLYCDDVDFSWRVRLVGKKVVYQSSAVVYHDKRLNEDGRWPSSPAERYYSAEAALLLAHKYSRPDRVAELLGSFKKSSEAHLVKAATAYEARQAKGALPHPIDPHHAVAVFTPDGYSTHRFRID